MAEELRIGSSVKANRDGKSMEKDTVGLVSHIACIDSDDYLYVRLPNGHVIGPSASSYWDVVSKTIGEYQQNFIPLDESVAYQSC